MLTSVKTLRSRCNSDSNLASKLDMNILKTINSKILIKDEAVSFFSKQSIELKAMLKKYKIVKKKDEENGKEVDQKNNGIYNFFTEREKNKKLPFKIKRSFSVDSLKNKRNTKYQVNNKNDNKDNYSNNKKNNLNFPDWIFKRIENFKRKKNEKTDEKPNLFLAFLGKE